jgi:cell fate (sporulation/competence/biofilm development) regulator YlbF (YheA/YmcA/DUF963 family)
MQEILDLTDRLGKAISSSPQAAALKAARQELDKDAASTTALKEYSAQADKMAALQQQNKPVEVDDKHKLEELHAKLAASETFKKFTAAQVEYVDLLRKVNEVLRKHLAGVEQG